METKTFLNYRVYDIIGGKETKGNKIGIELELEGRNVGLQDVATKGWARHNDGSLRGESVEYTLTAPKEVDEAKKLVVDLFTKFKKENVKFNNSIRTSTHIHLNFSDKPLKQAINFFALFTLFEEVLQHYSGEDRKGNLFCISTREAEGIVEVLSEALYKSNLHRFSADRYKYAACNLSTLYKFGTVEVRTMRGATSAEQVNTWIDILNDMYQYSLKMVSPVDLIRGLSVLGADMLMREVFGAEHQKELLRTYPKVNELHYSLMEGARILQIFAYEFDEDFRAEVKVDVAAFEARLPARIPEGPLAGKSFMIIKPNGVTWVVRPSTGAAWWDDGVRDADDRSVQWSAALGRFVVHYPNGDIVPCNWYMHHVHGNEGRPEVLRDMPMIEPEDWGQEPEEEFVERDEDWED